VLAWSLLASAVGCASQSSGARSEEPAADPERACTEIGCLDGLHVELVPSEGWAPGRYTFLFEADGAAQSCEATLPLPGCEEPAVSCSGASFAQLGASGCALPAAQHGFASIDFPDALTEIRVRVERDGQTLVDRSLAPTYREVQPNGPGCGPVCRTASEQLAVSPTPAPPPPAAPTN
jgi:hypothetical protein